MAAKRRKLLEGSEASGEPAQNLPAAQGHKPKLKQKQKPKPPPPPKKKKNRLGQRTRKMLAESALRGSAPSQVRGQAELNSGGLQRILGIALRGPAHKEAVTMPSPADRLEFDGVCSVYGQGN